VCVEISWQVHSIIYHLYVKQDCRQSLCTLKGVGTFLCAPIPNLYSFEKSYFFIQYQY